MKQTLFEQKLYRVFSPRKGEKFTHEEIQIAIKECVKEFLDKVSDKNPHVEVVMGLNNKKRYVGVQEVWDLTEQIFGRME